jgi:hypothetical protein
MDQDAVTAFQHRLLILGLVLAFVLLQVWRAEAVTPPTPQPTIEEMIAAAWPDDYETAMCIATLESGLEPTAIDATGTYAGLFQIAWRLHRQSFAEMLDPALNIAMARQLYDASGWAPWANASALCSRAN